MLKHAGPQRMEESMFHGYESHIQSSFKHPGWTATIVNFITCETVKAVHTSTRKPCTLKFLQTQGLDFKSSPLSNIAKIALNATPVSWLGLRTTVGLDHNPCNHKWRPPLTQHWMLVSDLCIVFGSPVQEKSSRGLATRAMCAKLSPGQDT